MAFQHGTQATWALLHSRECEWSMLYQQTEEGVMAREDRIIAQDKVSFFSVTF